MKETRESIEQTRQWILENFEESEDLCMKKSVIFEYYLESFRSCESKPLCIGHFAQVFREVFPEVSMRRLGGRGTAARSFCGIGPKPGVELETFHAQRRAAAAESARERKRGIESVGEGGAPDAEVAEAAAEPEKKCLCTSKVRDMLVEYRGDRCTDDAGSPTVEPEVAFCLENALYEFQNGEEDVWFHFPSCSNFAFEE